MKKFCSECGHPVELNKKFCSECGAANPSYNVAHEIPGAHGGAALSTIEQLRLKKETIERELQEIEREQEEARKKEALKREMEELERQRAERQEKEKAIKEKFEREQLESVFKKQIDEVKEETERYKQQTNLLLTELRNVIVQIEEENKRLKQEVEQISKVQPVFVERVSNTKIETPEIEANDDSETIIATTETTHQLTEPAATKKQGRFLWAIGAIALLMLGGLGWLIFNLNSGTPTPPPATTPTQTETTESNTAATPEETAATETIAEPTNTETPPPVLVNENSPTTTENKQPAVKAATAVTATPAALDKSGRTFTLTPAKARTDLTGQRLAGCGIQLSSGSEIEDLSGITLMENSPTGGYVKYKMNLTVNQNGEVYHVAPYMYYTPAGKFLRVDATNCE